MSLDAGFAVSLFERKVKQDLVNMILMLNIFCYTFMAL